MFIHKDDPEYKALQNQMSTHQEETLDSPNQCGSSKQHNEGKLPDVVPAHVPHVSDLVLPTPSTKIVGRLFSPINKVIRAIQEPTNFTPGTPLRLDKSLTYDDRRTSAATVWGTLISPRVAVWEQRLHSEKHSHCRTELATPPGF